MGFYAIWPYFVGMLIILSLANTPLLRLADVPPTTVRSRDENIDGLRGFLALSVFFHHAAIYHQYLLTGNWLPPPTRFYANLGPIGVAVFFMITGYLFWTQMLKVKGKPNFLKLYVGRIFRIVPLYLALAFIVLLGVGILTRWHLEEPPFKVAKDVLKWLAGGVFIGGEVNGSSSTFLISAGVTWSLSYEWMFYATLLVTSFFARKFVAGALLPAMGMLVSASNLALHSNLLLLCVLMFSIGMITASARLAIVANPFGSPQWALSIGVIGCLVLALLGFDVVYDVLPIMILGLAFGLIVSGATVFGLLLTRPAKRLGDVSYGIYLLQGPVLFLSFAPPSIRSFSIASALGHWGVVIIAGGTLVILATVAHIVIELPGIEAGRWMLAKVEAMRRGSVDAKP